MELNNIRAQQAHTNTRQLQIHPEDPAMESPKSPYANPATPRDNQPRRHVYYKRKLPNQPRCKGTQFFCFCVVLELSHFRYSSTAAAEYGIAECKMWRERGFHTYLCHFFGFAHVAVQTEGAGEVLSESSASERTHKLQGLRTHRHLQKEGRTHIQISKLQVGTGHCLDPTCRPFQ